MYIGQIYHQGNPVTVGEAVSLNLIDVDENGDVWLKQDSNHQIKIQGDLRLN